MFIYTGYMNKFSHTVSDMYSTGIRRSDIGRLWTGTVWDGGEHITADYLWPQQKDGLPANTTVIPAPIHNRTPVTCDLMHVFLQRNANIWDSRTGQRVCYAAGLEFFSMQSYSGGRWRHISKAWDQKKPQELRRHVSLCNVSSSIIVNTGSEQTGCYLLHYWSYTRLLFLHSKLLIKL